MGKPLLTDELLEQAKRKAQTDKSRKHLYFDQRDLEQLAGDETFDTDGLTERIEVEASVVKSRRIENEKREIFRHKLNKILFIIVLLVLALLFAMFNL